MDGNFESKVLCCFCGKFFDLKDSLVLAVFPNIESEESQGLYCHKKCFVDRINKSIILHPDITNDI